MGQSLRGLFILHHLHGDVQGVKVLCYSLNNSSHDGAESMSLREIMQSETSACLFTKKGRGLHICVSERQMVMKRVQVDQKSIQVVAQCTKHATVTGTLADIKE